MTVKTTYKCDVCRDEMEPQALFAVYFSGMKKFKLTNPVGHQGIHICVGCAEQIAAQYPATTAGQLGSSQGKGEAP